MNGITARQFQHIFLLSHMRAYSSLAGHILGSHPEVNGYYEMHLSYTRKADLDEQFRAYSQLEAVKPGSIYLFDKLLHNDYVLDPRILEDSKDRILVSVRSPVPTLKSIIHLFQSKSPPEPYADIAEATHYYIQRLQSLAAFSRENPERYYYFDAELMKTDSSRLLRALTHWCGLKNGLSDRYRTFSLTGKARAGDSSEIIHSGKIETSENHYPQVELDAEPVAHAERAYTEYRAIMLDNARASLAM